MFKVLLTCPPMIGMFDDFKDECVNASLDVTIPKFTQEMSEGDLCKIIGDFDGWIIGDDPATRRVIESGIKGKLKACMRWGVGTNNVDFEAFAEHEIPIENTPGVFGREVADLACHYITALARKTFAIDAGVKSGCWHKPIGQSLWSTRALIVGFGDIGRNLAKRLEAHDVEVWFVDPYVTAKQSEAGFKKVTWPHALSEVDFVIFTAPLNEETFHLFNSEALTHCRPGLKLVNVGRGPLVDETALINGLKAGLIDSAALDVFENEPVSRETHSELFEFSDKLIFGSHNGSNTREAVAHVSRLCIQKLNKMLVMKENKNNTSIQ